MLGLAVLVVASHLAYERLARFDRSSRTEWLLHRNTGEYDYLVLGSSAAERSIATGALAEATGASVLNLAAAGTAYPEQHLIFELFASRGRARTLLFQLDTWGLSDRGYSYPFHEYLYLSYLDNEVIRSNLAEYYGEGQVKLWRSIPMLKYAEFNVHIGLKDVFDRLRGKRAYAPAAQQLYEGPGTFATGHEPFAYRWDPRRERYFHRILDSALARQVEVVLLLAPVHEDYRELEQNEGDVVRFYRDQARQRGLRLFIFEAPDFLRDQANFANWTHLNRQGAERYTGALATFLEEARH